MMCWQSTMKFALSFFLASQAFAGLTDYQLEARLNELSAFAGKGLDIAALEREAAYERARLSLDERAALETQRMQQQVRFAVMSIYQDEISRGQSPQDAKDVVRTSMERDMSLLAPEMQEEVRQFVEAILSRPTPLSTQEPRLLSGLVNAMKRFSQLRLSLLKQSVSEIENKNQNEGANDIGRTEYRTSRELLNAMVDDRIQSERWVSTSNITARSGVMRGYQEEFSAQVQAEFLGIKVSAGPVFKFKKSITTQLDIKGEGLYPLFDSQGVFDLNLRNPDGSVRQASGRQSRRFIFFTCEIEGELESEAVIKGGFKVMGVGAEAQVVESYRNTINLSSRRVLVPNSLDGRIATLGVLASLCHRDFLATRTSNGRSVKQNLDTMMRNMASGLTYVNPEMRCVLDRHCNNWFNREVLPIHRHRTVPRCVQEVGNPEVMACKLRGGNGANCRVVRNNRVVSSGYFEYKCAEGLRCNVTKVGGWGGFLNTQWIPWEGQCRPEQNVIEVDIVSSP